MSDEPRTDGIALSAAALSEWAGHVERVLRGVAHSLNNRGAALAALVELTSAPAEEAGVLREILAGEQRRVRDLVQVLRIIGAPQGVGAAGEPEAFLPADVAADVSLVLEQYPDLRDGAVQIDASGAVPVRAPRWAFGRALIALAAGKPGATRSNPLRLVMVSEGEWLTIADTAATDVQTPRLATELASYMGGDAIAGRYGIRLPTLESVRRREGR